MRKHRRAKQAVILLNMVLVAVISVFFVHLFISGEIAPVNNPTVNNQTAGTAFVSAPKPLSTIAPIENPVITPSQVAPTLILTPTETPEPPPVVMIFCGDILLDGSVRTRIESAGLDSVIQEAHREPFIKADITMANLENSVSTRGTPMEDKQYTYRADPEFLTLLNDMGVDIVSVANNHTLDFGRDAFADTLDYLSQYGIIYVGGGRNKAEAMKWQIIQAGKHKVAFLAASRVLPVVDWYAGAERSGLFSTYDPADLNRQITLAREEADYVVVYVHWGVERKDTPEQYQKDMARGYINAGADLVIGSHPHVLQGFEYYNGGLIAYSLGNFIFNDTKKDTAALEITINPDKSLSARVLPYEIISRSVSPLTDAARLEAMRVYLSEISFNTVVNEDFMIVGF